MSEIPGGVSDGHEEVFEIPDHLPRDINRIREFLVQKFDVGPHDVTVFTSDVL
jgi:hypothetical protein